MSEADIIHVLKEDVSPPEANVWTMWCGAQCIVLDDGETHPFMDFYLEIGWRSASCLVCVARFEASGVTAHKRTLVDAATYLIPELVPIRTLK